MGLTFKENCPDIRNSRVIDIIKEFENYGSQVDVYDPWVDPQQTLHEYNITPIVKPVANHYDAIILAVKHEQFIQMGAEAIRLLGKEQHVLYDIKYLLPANQVDGRL
jgi:UDP-N-acetyl-D-galactosamine dehydrogenase